MLNQLLKSISVVSFLTSCSRVLGLVRDHLIARMFGASASMDVFVVALRLSNFLRQVFSEGGFSQAFVPVLNEYKSLHGNSKINAFIDQIATVLGLALFVISALGVLLAPVLIIIFAPAFLGDEAKYILAVDLMRIMFPYILFISMVALCAGILNTYGRFFAPAFTPVLFNLCIIFATIYVAPNLHEPIKALAWAVLVSGLIQLLFQIPFLLKIKKLPRFNLRSDLAGGRKVLKLMLPAIFSVSIVQINVLVDTMLASFLQTGSISWLYFSNRLMDFPLGVFGVALATVIIPSLATAAVENTQHFSSLLKWGIKLALLISIPSAIGLIVLSEPILTTLFQYGNFSVNDVRLTQQSLIAYSVGLPFFILTKILLTGFFAQQNTLLPFKISIVTITLNIVFNLLLITPLAHAGLALATSMASGVQVCILYFFLKKEKLVTTSFSQIYKFLLQVSVSVLLMSGVLILLASSLTAWTHLGMVMRAIQLAFLIGIGAAIYFATLWCCGFRYRYFTRKL